ncbi:MAG TPA: hypothetical protein ACHBX0_06110 [Arsenophonus sp.]
MVNRGKHKQGKKILFNLVKQRGFYSMVMAQKLNIMAYSVKLAVATKPGDDIDS